MTTATSTAILRIGDILIATIQEALSDSAMRALQSRLLDMVIDQRARGLVIDVSELDVLDSFGTRILSDIAAAVQLRGARTVIVGMRPEVALSMMLLGLTLPRVETALDLDLGLHLLRARGVS